MDVGTFSQQDRSIQTNVRRYNILYEESSHMHAGIGIYHVIEGKCDLGARLRGQRGLLESGQGYVQAESRPLSSRSGSQ